MDILLEESALELDFTQLAPSMNPDLPRVLVREVLMLSQDITPRTTGHLLLLLMDTPLAMDVDIPSVLSALELVSTQLVQSMSPDQLKGLAEDTCTRLIFYRCVICLKYILLLNEK